MGCGACRIIFEENSDSPLDAKLIKLRSSNSFKMSEIEMLNELYDKASITIEMIELMRETIIDKLDELIYNTGACVFHNPDIITCIRCVLWKISASSEGNIKKAELKLLDEEPFIQINGENKFDPNTRLIINLLINYISEVYSLKNQIKKIDQNLPKLVYIITENNENYLFGARKDADEENENNPSIFKTSNESQIEIFNLIRNNNSKIKRAMNLFPDLVRLHGLTFGKIRYEFSIYKNNLDYLINIDKVGVEVYSKNIEDIHEISFYSRNIINVKRKDKYLELEDENNVVNLYMKSVSDGKNKYYNIIQTKKYLKAKRKNN